MRRRLKGWARPGLSVVSPAERAAHMEVPLYLGRWILSGDLPAWWKGHLHGEAYVVPSEDRGHGRWAWCGRPRRYSDAGGSGRCDRSVRRDERSAVAVAAARSWS